MTRRCRPRSGPGSLAPPKHILNAPTRWMKQEGFGAGYVYDHDTAAGFSGQNYFPSEDGARKILIRHGKRPGTGLVRKDGFADYRTR